ncbi:hypothetical protein ABK040_014771 [Willaertia magna]
MSGRQNNSFLTKGIKIVVEENNSEISPSNSYDSKSVSSLNNSFFSDNISIDGKSEGDDSSVVVLDDDMSTTHSVGGNSILQQIDPLLKYMKSTIDESEIAKAVNENLEKERLNRLKREEELYSVNSKLVDHIKRNAIEVELLKGQLNRRNEMLDQQREAFFRELMILREELFKKHSNPNYKPTDFSLYSWERKYDNIDNLTSSFDFQSEKLSPASSDMRSLQSNVMDPTSLSTLKEQSQKVAETLSSLKKLETKRKHELEKLQKEKEETERLKKKLLVRAKKQKSDQEKLSQIKDELNEERNWIRMLQEKRQVLIQKDDIRDTHGREELKPNELQVVFGDNRQSKNNDKSKPVRSETTPGLENDNNSQQKKEPNFISTILKLKSANGEQPEGGDEESFNNLEHQIHDFQGKFKGLYNQMNHIKSRLKFYKENQVEFCDGTGPQGDVTLVFTDVQDSTRLWELDLETMASSIKVHNNLMRQILKETKGFEVKTEGDAFMCAFQNVEDAVEFTLQAQLRLITCDWSETLLKFDPSKVEYDETEKDENGENITLFRGLRVRMGIHTGRPIVEKDPVTGRYDYFGPVVNRAARVEGQAAGGQIVISSSVWAEIMDKIENFSVKIWTKFLGTVALKGMDEPETIRMILPYRLRNRKFPEVKVVVDQKSGIQQLEEQEHLSSLKELHEKLEILKQEHEQLEKERTSIHHQIQFKLRIKALEDTMLEKDNVIKYLRTKIDNVKKTYKEAIQANNEKQRNQLLEQTKKLQSDIDTVMQKYEEMKEQYSTMKINYDEVVKVFNKKVKYELEGVKEDINSLTQEVKQGEDKPVDWQMEKKMYEVQLESKDKLIKEKDGKIQQLRSAVRLARMDKKMERIKGFLRHDSSTALKTRSFSVDDNSPSIVTEIITPTETDIIPLFPENKPEQEAIYDANGELVMSGEQTQRFMQYMEDTDKIDKKTKNEESFAETDIQNTGKLASRPKLIVRPSQMDINKLLRASNHIEKNRKNIRSPPLFVHQIVTPRLGGIGWSYKELRELQKKHKGHLLESFEGYSVTLSDITSILRDAIREAVEVSRKYDGFNWRLFIRGQHVSNVDDVNVIPSTYLKKSETKSKKRNTKSEVKIFDEKSKQFINIPKKAIKEWGIINAAKFIAEKQANAPQEEQSPGGVRLASTVVNLRTNHSNYKKSYSRMLEYHDEGSNSTNQNDSMDSKDSNSKISESKFEPLGAPFRKMKYRPRSTTPNHEKETVKRKQSYEKKKPSSGGIIQPPSTLPPVYSLTKSNIQTNSTLQSVTALPKIVNQSNDNIKELLEHYTSTFENYELFKNMSKEERRQEILNLIYFDRTKDQFENMLDQSKPPQAGESPQLELVVKGKLGKKDIMASCE